LPSAAYRRSLSTAQSTAGSTKFTVTAIWSANAAYPATNCSCGFWPVSDPKRFALPWEQRGDADPQAEAVDTFPALLDDLADAPA
jgi:hypothetical protein